MRGGSVFVHGLYANAARINQLLVPMMATSGIFPIQS
jgi:hypothetical protein